MRIYFMSARIIGCVVLASLFLISSCAWRAEATSAQDASKEFQQAVEKYIAIQKKAVGTVPPIGKQVSDPALIAKHQQQIAEAIRALRPTAKAGEIFTPSVRQSIASTLKQKVDGKDGAGAKSAILGEGNPQNPGSATPVNLAVNATYPTTAPLSTVPPSVLMALPPLPEGLEYRFVGKTLILRDTEANLIVDLAPNMF
jgi:hypothetical protein